MLESLVVISISTAMIFTWPFRATLATSRRWRDPADLTLELSATMKSIMKNRIVRVVIAALIGAAIGSVVYAVSRVTGRNLYIIIGAVAAAAAVLLLQWYWRTAQLTEVKITVPQLSELTFVVNNDGRQVAWKLYIETTTRVSTQSLLEADGFIREALTSLYGLFATTRDILKASRPSVPVSGEPTVEYLAVTMLNRELRPFLSRWHPRLREYEKSRPDGPEADWPENVACRGDLAEVQAHLRDFALSFARLAGVRDAESAMGLTPPANPPA